MDASISDERLSQFSEFVLAAMGLHFPPARWPDLRRGLAAAARELGFDDDVNACAKALMSSAMLSGRQLEALAGGLTVGETYFFRQRAAFDVLADHVLPRLIHERRLAGDRRLRIWSSACCTGEEPYSIAILLHRIIPDLADWDITLLGTDINPQYLRKAEQGVFGRWSFRDTQAWVREDHFTPTADGRFAIVPEVRRMVRFVQLNLAENTYPSLANDTSAMDVIFCRNVLMYFDAAHVRQVIERLSRASADGGWLVVGPTEPVRDYPAPYVPVYFDGVVFYCNDRDGRRCGERTSKPADRAKLLPAQPAQAVTPRDDASKLQTEIRRAEVTDVSTSQALENAEALYARGDYAEVIRVCEPLIARGDAPEVPAALLNLLASSHANRGELRDALACIDRCVAIDKLNPASHYLRATILLEQQAIEDAIQSLRRTLYVDPDFALAHFVLGNVMQSRGQVEESRRHFENALRLLRRYSADALLPGSDGAFAGQFIEAIETMLGKRVMA